MFEKYLVKHDIHTFQTMELWSIEAIKRTVMSGLGKKTWIEETLKL
ncbi:hypothetical protein HMPREF9413_5627 [Paenibacillus sp. HGF7]|nr:hypothetical protein HMPREF9413_5627 [Paenibacillus sp. HGF7]